MWQKLTTQVAVGDSLTQPMASCRLWSQLTSLEGLVVFAVEFSFDSQRTWCLYLTFLNRNASFCRSYGCRDTLLSFKLHPSAHLWPFWMSLKAQFECLHSLLNEKYTVGLCGSSPIKRSHKNEQEYKMFPKVFGLRKRKCFEWNASLLLWLVAETCQQNSAELELWTWIVCQDKERGLEKTIFVHVYRLNIANFECFCSAPLWSTGQVALSYLHAWLCVCVPVRAVLLCLFMLPKHSNTVLIKFHSSGTCVNITSCRECLTVVVCVCVCVSSVHCLSQEWETSEYLLTTNRVNAACRNLLWECGYGWCPAFPLCCASPSTLSLGFSAAHVRLLAGLISSAGHIGFYPALNFCMSLSLLHSNHINERCPSPKCGPCSSVSLPLAQDCCTCFDTLSVVQSENMMEILSLHRRDEREECEINWTCM